MSLNRRIFLSSLGSLPFAASSFLTGSESSSEDSRFVLAHATDPQLGFGPGREDKNAFECDVERLHREIDIMNEVHPDLVLWTGDMMHSFSELKTRKDLLEELGRLTVPTIIAPGNHDLGDPVTQESIDRFKSYLGPDFQSVEIKGWKIITMNTQYYREGVNEALRQNFHNWFTSELQDAKNRQIPVIVSSHIPPFAASVDEADEYYNIPSCYRKDLLDLCLDCGVRFWLAGHTHLMMARSYRGISILNSETTSANFDQRPHGFRLMTFGPQNDYEWTFRSVD